MQLQLLSMQAQWVHDVAPVVYQCRVTTAAPVDYYVAPVGYYVAPASHYAAPVGYYTAAVG